MRFGQQFEYHKIPEWYNKYLDYDMLNEMTEIFKNGVKNKESMKLPGFYIFTQKKAIIPLDVFKVPALEKKDEEF